LSISIFENPIVDLEKLRKENQRATILTMKREGLDAILVTACDSIRYLTCEKLYHQNDWWQDHYAAILTSDGQFWASTALSLYQKEQGAGWEYFPFPCGTLIPKRWVKLFQEVLDHFGLHGEFKIGLDQLSYNVVREFKKEFPSTILVDFLKPFLMQRSVKNKLEIKLLREAARVTDIGMRVGLEVGSTPGVRENEVFAAMIGVMTEAGSEVTPHNSMISSGIKGIEDFLITDKKIREGELFNFDIGCMIEGYHGDSGRTGYCGRESPSEEVKELYQAIYDCHMAGIREIRSGVRGSEIDAVCRKVLKEHGYPTYETWSGHGMGTRECEYPLLGPSAESREFDIELKPGMVIGLEPHTHKEGIAAASLEDMILITETGCEKLTKTNYLDYLLE